MITTANQEMVLEKSTKNTHVYTAKPGTMPIIRTLYVDKFAFEGNPAKEITLTIVEK